MTAGNAPGWYPDPSRRFELRYFNGERWTADVAVHGERMIDSGEPLVPGRPGWTPVAHRRPRGFALTSMIAAIAGVLLGWIPFVFVIGAVGALLAVVFGVLGLRTARAHQGSGRSFAIAGLVIAPLALASCVLGLLFTREVWDEVTGTGEYDLDEQPCVRNGDGLVVFGGTIRNESLIERDYVLTIRFSSGGAEVFETDLDVTDVGPESRKSWTLTERVTVADRDLSCQVTDVRSRSVFDSEP